MQNKKIKEDLVLITLPREALTDSGIEESDVLQITAERGKIVIEAVGKEEMEEYVCDGACESCLVREAGCEDCFVG